MVQSAVGFGANLLAMPIVVQFAPELVPGAVLTAGVTLNVLMAFRERSAIDLRPLSGAMVGRIGGTVIGMGALAMLSERGVQYVVAFSVLAMVAIAMVAVAPARTAGTMVTAGLASGFGAITSGIGGPPMALTLRDADGPEIRSSLAAFFCVATAITLAGLVLADKLGTEHLRPIAGLIPAVVIGYLLSGPMLPVVDRGWTRPAILLLSAASALLLLVRLLVG